MCNTPVARCFGIASGSVIQAIRPTNAQVPSSDSTAGSSNRAPTITMKTVTAAATAMPLKNVIRMTNRPSSAMITVAAANCTARPEVRTDSSAASRGDRPWMIASRYRLMTISE